jgi:hypothetical protein
MPMTAQCLVLLPTAILLSAFANPISRTLISLVNTPISFFVAIATSCLFYFVKKHSFIFHNHLPMMIQRVVLLLIGVAMYTGVYAQQTDSIRTSTTYIDKVSASGTSIENKLEKKSSKVLLRLQKQELKLKNKLARTDSAKANAVFGDARQQYASLEQRLQNISSKKYIPSLDTLATSLKFLQENPQFLSVAKNARQKLNDASAKIKSLQTEFQKAEEIQKFLKERKDYLKQQLTQSGFAKQFKQLNKTTYYYGEQLNEYKEMIKDHTKAEKKGIELLSKTKLFKDFMRKNSQLASMFRLPFDPNDPNSQASLAGLQSRAQVNGLIQQQLAGAGPNAQAQFRQNMQDAQGQLNQLKNKMSQFGKGSSNTEMPEGFKPNDQKTKSFLKRLELGTNIQSQKANGYFPTTSDIGVSVGYKLNDRSIIGIGGSYKLGWGKDIRHINITHQGIGLRSFIDYKIKGSFWITGGYEMNYRSEFKNIDVLKELNAWQQSGLIGLSKVISLKTKFFKNTKLQLLWDFLSYHQLPRTQPIVFRIGYSFK